MRSSNVAAAGGVKPSKSDHHRPNVLMLCDGFRFSYRVMRCFDAAGARVHVLGGTKSNGLRFSRFCQSYRQSRQGFSVSADQIREEINAWIKELAIDLVLAGDPKTTRTLIPLDGSLSAACFPMASIDQYNLLHNKWSFAQLCQQLQIRCPPTELVSDRAELLRRLNSGATQMPSVAKPLDFEGSRGIFEIKNQNYRDVVESIDYQPILVQKYIEGDDIGASVYCDHGEIQAFIAHNFKWTYSTFQSAEIQDAIAKIASLTKVSGILNFDMRIAQDGAIYWFECNPRCFFKMALSMLAGINFASFGLPHATSNLCASIPTGTNVRTLKAIAMELPRPWRLTSRDWALLRFIASDPIPFIREKTRIDWDY